MALTPTPPRQRSLWVVLPLDVVRGRGKLPARAWLGVGVAGGFAAVARQRALVTGLELTEVVVTALEGVGPLPPGSQVAGRLIELTPAELRGSGWPGSPRGRLSG